MKSLIISRRKFLQWLLGFSALAAIFLWFKGTKRTLAVQAPHPVAFNLQSLKDGVSFIENIIVLKKQKKVSVYSSHCTHLGCKISSEQNGKLVCPCHGSEFSLNGQVLKGPAIKPLKALSFSIDKNSGEITVYVY